MIYLDSAATSLLKPKSVGIAMHNALQTMASPGRGSHIAAMRAADRVYECRELACRLFNYEKPERIVFTLNASHALNIAIRSTVKSGDTVCVSGYEHNSVTRTLKGIGAKIVVAKSELFDTQETIDAFKKLIPHVDAVVCNHVSNVFGFILPVYEIAELCQRNNVPFILDASQSAGIIDIDMQKLKASFVAMPGHKGLLGPQGTGLLVCNTEPKPLLFGGTGSDSLIQGMPEYLPDICEAGTHNVVGIAGLAEGIKYVIKTKPSHIGRYEQALCSVMAESLKSVEGLEVFASNNGTQAGVLSVRHESINVETLCEKLGARQIAARCGLHCSPFAHQTVGTIDTGTLRFSFSPFVTKKQVIGACNAFKNILISEKLMNM